MAGQRPANEESHLRRPLSRHAAIGLIGVMSDCSAFFINDNIQ